MITMIARLLRGDTKFFGQCRRAREFWETFFKDKRDWDTDRLAEALLRAQPAFYEVFDQDRSLAKEIMALTCLGTLYDEAAGFGANERFATKVAQAFLEGGISDTIKENVRSAVALFGINMADDTRKKGRGPLN